MSAPQPERWRDTRPVPLARVYATPYAALVRADEVVGVVAGDRLWVVGTREAVKRSMREEER